MKITLYSCCFGKNVSKDEMIFTTFPSAPEITSGFCARVLMGSSSKYPRGLLASGERCPSVSAESPPAETICIIREVPDRGMPDTTVIISMNWPLRSQRKRHFITVASPLLDRQKQRRLEIEFERELDLPGRARRHGEAETALGVSRIKFQGRGF